MKRLQTPGVVLGLVASVTTATLTLWLLAHWAATEQDPIMRAIETLALLVCIALPIFAAGIATLRFLGRAEG